MKEIKLEDLHKNTDKYEQLFAKKLEKEKKIIANIHENKEEFEEIQKLIDSQFKGIEDMFYRYYHHSYKVYDLQSITKRMIKLFQNIGECSFYELDDLFREIIAQGIEKEFKQSANMRWSYETRPILEAFFHAQHIMNMMIKYGLPKNPEEEQPGLIAQGWGTVLHLYNIR